MKKLVVATSNEGKIREIRHILSDLPFMIEPFGMDVDETGTTFEQNARLKARAVAEVTGEITLADDSGLSVDVLDGRPGVYSKRYGPTDAARIVRLLDELKGVVQRSAYFSSAMVVFDPESEIEFVSEGRVEGMIVDRPMGTNGFGYDPIFYCPELGKTFGEATAEEKNLVSHRARALAVIKEKLGGSSPIRG